MNQYKNFNNYEFAERLFNLRKGKKYSQEFVGLELGITGKSYGKYEQMQTFPSLENLIKLANLYEVPIDYILCGIKPAHNKNLSHFLAKYPPEKQILLIDMFESMLALIESNKNI